MMRASHPCTTPCVQDITISSSSCWILVWTSTLQTAMDGEVCTSCRLTDAHSFVWLLHCCVSSGTGLLFTAPPPATVSISASCWLSRGPPSLPAPLVMWRLLQINVRKWRRVTSSAPSSYMVRTNPNWICFPIWNSIYSELYLCLDLIRYLFSVWVFWTFQCRCSGEAGCDEQGDGLRSVGLQSSESRRAGVQRGRRHYYFATTRRQRNGVVVGTARGQRGLRAPQLAGGKNQMCFHCGRG